MNRIILALLVVLAGGLGANAQGMKPSPRDANLSADERKLLALLEARPDFARVVYQRLRKRYEKQGGPKVATPATPALPSPEDLFSRGVEERAKEAGDVVVPVAKKNEEGQRLFIRRDNLDSYLYGRLPRDKAQGASITYTDNFVSGSRTAQIDGFLGYVVAGDVVDPDAGKKPGSFGLRSFAIVPWVSAHGNLNSANTKAEKSALKFAVDTQHEFIGGLFDSQYTTLTPYYQTDFRGYANVWGASASWTPADCLASRRLERG